jgi:pimeloyl-ACP methyl ester carboxylesterase
VRAHDLVIWCDWGRALEIGAETSAPEIADVQFQNCDIIRTTHIAMDIQCGDRALVHDIRYENIRVETDDVCPGPRMQGSRGERYVQNPKDQSVPNLLVIVISKNPYSQDPERGNVRDITFGDVSVTGRRAPRSFFNGLDAQHTVQGITIDNLRLNGRLANTAAEANLSVGQYVSGVRFGKAVPLGAARAGERWPSGSLDTWHGYARHHFTVDGCPAWVVEPKQAAPGNPWTWCMEFPDAFTERTGVLQLLEKGFHHVHISVGNTHGSPAAVKHFGAFYQVLQAGGLAKKGALVGISRGGLYCYNFAAEDPSRVACNYGDAPVCDFKSWPGGKGKGNGSSGDWAALLRNYGFKDEAEALAYKKNPVDELAPLAAAKLPLIHVVGDADKVVPPEENTLIIEQRYRELGGKVVVIHKPGCDHHPHGLDNPQPIVDFILEHAQ